MTVVGLLGLGLGSWTSSAGAQTCVPGPAGTCLLQPSGAQSHDVSPYCFLPTLLRGQQTTNYAVTAEDEEGVCHDFRTYFRVDLPPDLLAGGETVTQAFLSVPYLFTFSIEGPPAPPPHAPVELSVHRVETAWVENGVSWQNRPSFDSEPLATVTGITNFGSLSFEVTELVRAWAHGTASNRGFVLTTPDEQVLGFNSWEAAVPATQKIALLIVMGPGSAPPRCGDVDVDDDVDAGDVALFRNHLASPGLVPLSPGGEARCTVIGEAGPCDLLDLVVLRRAIGPMALPPGIAPVCSAAP